MKLDAVIFDFDDTLVASNCLFDQAREDLYHAMRARSFAYEDEWAEYLDRTDIANVERQGYFSANCFPDAMRDTYLHFAAKSGAEADMEAAAAMEARGWHVFDEETQLIEGAEELLQALSNRARLFLLTQGEAHIQQRRLERSGLLPYFEAYTIVRRKDVDAYRAMLVAHAINAAHSWVIGNSMRSDINPAIAAGINAAHYAAPAWPYEYAEPVGGHNTLERLLDFLELIRDENQSGCHTI